MASLSTLTDNFDDGSIDVAHYWSSGYDPTMVVESGGHLNLTVPASTPDGDVAYIDTRSGDFANTSVQVEVLSYATAVDSQSVMFLINSDVTVAVFIYGGKLNFNISMPVNSATGLVTYDPVAHRFWRIESSGSTIAVKTSPTSEVGSWTTQLSCTDTWATTGTFLEFDVFANSTPPTDQVMVIDNLNVSRGSRSFSGTSSGGSTLTSSSETASATFQGSASGGGHLLVQTIYQVIPQKDYEYRVYTHSGTFVGIWKNVKSDFSYTQSVNEAPTELNVEIARSPDNISVVQDVLLDTSGSPILDTNSQTILVPTSSKNAVGAGTDVEINYNVDVYAFYGGYESLLDTNGSQILDTDGQPILVEFGSPNGKRVYSGYIADYEMTYGKSVGVKVIVVPHATEMNHIVFKSGSNTTVSYLSTDPISMARANMDSYIAQGGRITYNSSSMPLSGWTSSYEFNLQTTKEVNDKVIELLPAGYYHYVDPASNTQYILTKGSTANHTFYYEKHIQELVLKKSITQLVNEVYYVGGDTGSGVDLFKHFTDATSISTYRPGLDRQSDSRVTLDTSATVLGQAEINEYKDPRYRTSVTISDAVYDIESIKLGDMIGFKNFDSFVDTLVLQVVSLSRQKHTVTLDLDMTVANDAKRLEEIKRNLLSEAVADIPTAPT